MAGYRRGLRRNGKSSWYRRRNRATSSAETAVALRPELVCEVAYEAMEGNRFRHTARFRRWRTDRTPESCTYEQLEVPVAYDLDEILGGQR